VSGENDDRIAYLAGDQDASVPAHERASLDELRGVLAARAIWEEPSPNLEDAIVAAIENEAHARVRVSPVRRRRTRRWLMWPRPALGFAGVAAAVLVAIVIVLGTRGGGPAVQRFAMIVSGTSLAPGAHGSATLTKTSAGWEIRLSATGLPHLARGRYYEAWLKNAAGILVPVGTFNDARQVTLWAGVPVTEFPTLTVTEQRAGGNPASSGRRVLTGTIRR
jgi:Anti-sigma-K factor rskA